MNEIRVKGFDFYDIISAVDKVQKRKNNNLMTSDLVKTAAIIHDAAKEYAAEAWTRAYSGFSVAGYQFRSKCCSLVFHAFGVAVTWIDAPEREHGRGDHIELTLIGLRKEISGIQKSFPGLSRKETGREEDFYYLSGY